MGEYDSLGRPVAKTRDPLLKFLGGCAVAAILIVVLFVGIAWYVGWRLTRDPAPGRPAETFLTGLETRYWCVHLEPDDAGLQAFFQNLAAVSDASRKEAVKGTFLESFPLARRRASLEEIAPLTLEGSIFTEPRGWAVRATLSHQVLRMRAALKFMRFMMSRGGDKAKSFEVDGISVTELREHNLGFALANAGNRVVAASDADRMRQVLATSAEQPHPTIFALRPAVTQQGEDGWAFIANTSIGSVASPLSIAAAVASFDLTTDDALVFRVVVSEGTAVPEGRAFKGSVEECAAVAAAFFPMFAGEPIEIEGSGARPPVDGARVFTGRIRKLTERIPEVIEWRRPSASRPPSPPSSDGPRSDTPAAPQREGSPKPPR